MILPTVLAIVLATGQPLPPTESPPKVHTFTTVKSQYELEVERQKRVALEKAREAEKAKKNQREEGFWKSGSITAYYNGRDKMNGESGITASGYDLDGGIYFRGYRILASDSRYDLGTLVDIQLKNGQTIHGVVLDRGGAIKGNKFDLVLPSYQACMDFGRQQMKFKIRGKIDV